MSTMLWLLEQLASIPRKQRCQGFNPNPPGTVHAGSTTDAVLAALADAHPRYLTHAQVVLATGRSRKAVSWSLCYLRSLGWIESCGGGDKRSPLYLKYRTIGGIHGA